MDAMALKYDKMVNHDGLLAELYALLGDQIVGFKTDPLLGTVEVTVPFDLPKELFDQIAPVVMAHDPDAKPEQVKEQEARQAAAEGVRSVDFNQLGTLIASMRESPEKTALAGLVGLIEQMAVAQGLVKPRDKK